MFKVVDGINVISEGNQQFTTAYGQAFYNQQVNPAFVQMEYFGYMRRDPDGPGFAFWLGKLNSFPSYIEAEMVRSRLSSRRSIALALVRLNWRRFLGKGYL